MRNVRLLIAFAAFQFILFPIPIITLFWKDQIGMSLADIMVLQAIFGLAVVLFEFPSGYVADRVGYRWSLLVSTTLLMAGWLLYTRAESFWAVAVAETAPTNVLFGDRYFLYFAEDRGIAVAIDDSGVPSETF